MKKKFPCVRAAMVGMGGFGSRLMKLHWDSLTIIRVNLRSFVVESSKRACSRLPGELPGRTAPA
jgi:hypothetical protein